MSGTTTALPAADLVVDRELADLAESFRFLLDVTPVNVADARASFLNGDTSEPAFVYRPLDDRPDVLRARLDAVDPQAVGDHALAHLLRAKHRQLELQIDMLSARGTDAFLPLSLELYGGVGPALLEEAAALLHDTPPAPSVPGPWFDAEAFVHAAEAELDVYRAVDPDIRAHVELREDTAGVMVSNGDVLVGVSTTVAPSRVDALLQHEIGTHVVTHVNGSRQPLRVLAAGLAGYEETQEGLAVLAEHLVGGLNATRLRELAARVVAVHRMIDGDSFGSVHAALTAAGLSDDSAFTTTMRVFRSGGFTKDAIYLRGLRDVLAYVRAGGGDELAEGHPRHDRPRPVDDVVSRVVAHHDDVELVQTDEVVDAVGALECVEELLERLVVARCGAAAGRQRAVRLVGEVLESHQPHVVAHRAGGHGQPGGRVLRLLGGNAVDDETDLHLGQLLSRSARHVTCSRWFSRSRAVGSVR